jgi:predicted dehydrogenase
MAGRGKDRLIRVGVVGVGRGSSFARGAAIAGMELVALCDIWKQRLNSLARQLKVAAYTDYRRFLRHDMDAVILANYFHEHAPLAIEALRAGRHVMSETSACLTIGQAVALCRAVEAGGKTYMLAENYPFTAFNQEMRRLYRAGEIGKVLYAEGEYNHPMSPEDRLRISPGLDHWRNWIPSTYYCTHAMAPLMHITGTMPASVIGLSIADTTVNKDVVRVGDPGSVILCRMDNGAVFRLFGNGLPGHSIWYRLHGQRGSMESGRGPGYWGPGTVRVVHEEWNREPAQPTERVYVPDFPRFAEEARRAGHGGGDFWTNHHFAEAIRTGRPPFLDVYRGVAMSVVGILAWKSALAGGKPFDVPDFSDERARKPHQNDHWSPCPAAAAPGQPPPSILGFRKPTAAQIAKARKIWRQVGYTGYH